MAPESPDTTSTSLVTAAYDAVLDMILSGTLTGGTILQERRLAEQLGVSRTPLREALGRLEGEGYVARQGRNLLVTKISMQEVMEVLAVRRLLEAEAVRLAVGRIPKHELAAIRRAITDMGDAAHTSNPHHWWVDDLLHLTIAEASGNALLARYVSELRNRTRMFGLSAIPERFDPGQREHLAILEAIEAGDADLAERRMRDHLENAKRGILDRYLHGRH